MVRYHSRLKIRTNYSISPLCHHSFRCSIDVATEWFAAIDESRIELLDDNAGNDRDFTEVKAGQACPFPLSLPQKHSDRKHKHSAIEDLEEQMRKYRRVRIRHSERYRVGENQIRVRCRHLARLSINYVLP